MPIYEYECQSCRKITEARQSIAAAPLSTCPACGGSLDKIISQTSFLLKGGGWYADGYSSNGAGSSCASGGCPAASSAAPACKGGTACGC